MVSINIFCKGGDVHAILRNPYRSEGGSHHAGNKMALGNIRERLELHFDAEASARIARDARTAYEVHIRMPYRTAPSVAGAATPSRAAKRRERRLAAVAQPTRTDLRCARLRPGVSRG